MIFDPYRSNRLSGDHALLYRESLSSMLELFREELVQGRLVATWTFGVPVFDQMTVRGQFESLIRCSAAVLEGEGSPGHWDGTEKAAFYTVYMNVLQQLQIEQELEELGAKSLDLFQAGLVSETEDLSELVFDVDEADTICWRQLIEAAWRHECDGPANVSDLDPVQQRLESIQGCRTVLERLADRALPDRCFEQQVQSCDSQAASAAVPMGDLADPLGTADSAPGLPMMAARLADLAGISGVTGTTDWAS